MKQNKKTNKRTKKVFINLRDVNLWNETKKKTRNVITYIQTLREPETDNYQTTKKFFSIIDKALSKTTPDEMLSAIGYRPKAPDLIYTWSNEHSRFS